MALVCCTTLAVNLGTCNITPKKTVLTTIFGAMCVVAKYRCALQPNTVVLAAAGCRCALQLNVDVVECGSNELNVAVRYN